MAISTIDDSAVRAAGLKLIGEPLAIDFANTEKLAVEPARDLIADERAHRAFWAFQSDRVAVPSELPPLERVRELRAAIRALLDSRMLHTAPETWAVETVNRVAAASPISPRLSVDWDAVPVSPSHNEVAVLLATVARSAIDVLTGADAARLHRCAADDCSMLFIATNAKRRWCTAAGCGNRSRVARHATRQRHTQVAAA